MISDGETPAPGKGRKRPAKSAAQKSPAAPQSPPVLTVLPGGKSTPKNQPGAQPPKAPKPQFGPGNPVPLAVRMAVRSFYLVQGLKPAQIGPMVGLSAEQVSTLARREGWTAKRNQKSAEKERKASELQDARADVEVSQIHEAIAMRTEELSVKTLDHCADLLAEKVIDSKSLQMASGAARNFVQIARMSRGLDARTNASDRPNQLNVGLFIVSGSPREMKQADAIPVEAKPIPASQ